MMKNDQKFYLLIIVCLISPLARGQTTAQIVEEIRKGELKKASTLLEQLSDKDAKEDQIIFMKALLSSDSEAARNIYLKLIEEYPNSKYSDDALCRLAQLNYAKGLYKTAQEMFGKVFIDYPHSPLLQQCHHWLGLTFQAMDQLDSAAFRFYKVIDDFPETEFTKLARENIFALNQEQADQESKKEVPKIHYAVQVGAFSFQQNALLRKDFFENKGYEVYLRTKVRDEKTLYLVWVGSFVNRQEARLLGEQIKKKYGVKYTLATE